MSIGWCGVAHCACQGVEDRVRHCVYTTILYLNVVVFLSEVCQKYFHDGNVIVVGPAFYILNLADYAG